MYGHRQSGEGQNTFVVNESGLCSLILSSQLPQTKILAENERKMGRFLP